MAEKDPSSIDQKIEKLERQAADARQRGLHGVASAYQQSANKLKLKKKLFKEDIGAGDRIEHEKHGPGTVVNIREGYVKVAYDAGYELDHDLNEIKINDDLRHKALNRYDDNVVRPAYKKAGYLRMLWGRHHPKTKAAERDADAKDDFHKKAWNRLQDKYMKEEEQLDETRSC